MEFNIFWKTSCLVFCVIFFSVVFCFVSHEAFSYEPIEIKDVQSVLKSEGFYKGPVDGSFGPQTKQAIKIFQRVNHLKPDGVAGKKTYGRLSRLITEKNVRISGLSRELDKLQEESSFYKKQIDALKQESAQKNKQIEELSWQQKLKNEKYVDELTMKEKTIEMKDHEMAKMGRDREYLAEEKFHLERLEALKNQELIRIKKSLETIIGSTS